ncbi:hypothetical protein [Streptomyces sp. NPDC094032]|uniref:hypothetical protein n=1 Tax=Streptomyces sp. NPDC094032 TaxID=3155308 RepID=UPI00332ED0BE
MRRSVGVRTAVFAAFAVVVLAGTAGCGTDGGGTAPSSARPEEKGPFTKERVSAEIDSVVADAGAPAGDPEWAGMDKDARPGTMEACTIRYKGYGEESDRVDAATHGAVAAELRERGWREAGKRKERAYEDGKVGYVLAAYKKRGWFMTVEFRDLASGDLYLVAMEESCTKNAKMPDLPLTRPTP